ncbi:hypothetical protein RRG08_006440 [Elysia crispata]|uniref:Uncharacterized protein n=1 Tax=Elysia crispata TaxID=231223 RepID=A0AAE1D870_9GAST|nr:hypothetical protein RRG08_006440 [Elysia crispata]
MERGFYAIVVLCLLICSCQGLDLTIKRESPTKSGPLKSISSLSVFKRVFSGTNGNAKDRRDVLVGSVTSTTPTQYRVANGRKIDADLNTEKATMRIEFLKQDDCTAEFTCQVRGLDPQGRGVVRSSSLVQQSGQTGDHVGGKSLMPAISLQLYPHFNS